MRRYRDLIRYHLESVADLAKEDGLSTLEFFAKMALLENAAPSNGAGDVQAQRPASKV